VTREDADTALAQAIRDHAEAYGIAEDGDMLNEYGVVAHWQAVTDDGQSRYTTHFARPTVPTHVAVGLFSVAVDLVGDEDDA
jgi:hypothetical protein